MVEGKYRSGDLTISILANSISVNMLELYGFPFSAMGTECNLYFYVEQESRAQGVADATIAEVTRIEAKYSRYLPGSVLSKINQAAQNGGEVVVDEDTAWLLDFAFSCHKRSGGLFDITSGVLRKAWADFTIDKLPDGKFIESLLLKVGMDKILWSDHKLRFTVPGMELDFGGICKEYASDRAADICVSHGVNRGLVDLGGDINVFGPHPNGDPWEIGIRHPRRPGELLGNVEIHKGSLASSGDYERCVVIGGVRYGHILNPKTGWPARGTASVSVVADKCVVAGSLTTIAILKGTDGVRWLESLNEKYLWVDEDGNQGGNLPLKGQGA